MSEYSNLSPCLSDPISYLPLCNSEIFWSCWPLLATAGHRWPLADESLSVPNASAAQSAAVVSRLPSERLDRLRSQRVEPSWTTLKQMAVCQNLVPVVNIKIAGKWMFIPLNMVLIGIDPYPNLTRLYQVQIARISSKAPDLLTENAWKCMIMKTCENTFKK